MCPENEKVVTKADALLCTHGHQDHIGDAVSIVTHYQPVVVGIYELCAWLQKKGAKQISPMNKGGTQSVAGVKSQWFTPTIPAAFSTRRDHLRWRGRWLCHGV